VWEASLESFRLFMVRELGGELGGRFFRGNKNLLRGRRRSSASTASALASGKEEAAVRVVPVHDATQCSLWNRNGKPPNG
jgi:hypothetical protein